MRSVDPLATGGGSGDGGGTQRVWFAQALRGLACLIVVWQHLGYDFLANPHLVSMVAFTRPDSSLVDRAPWIQTTIFGWLDTVSVGPGTFGVGLFFLISGFVIPFSLEHNTVGGFFTRRFFRLYPTLWVAIGVTVVALALQAWFAGSAFPYGGDVLGSSGALIGTYLGKPLVDPAYWTLAVEELFYVIAAVCAWRSVLHRRATPVLLGTVLAAASLGLARMATPTTSVPPLWYLRTHLARNSAFVVFILIGLAFHEHYRGSLPTGQAVAVGAWLVGLFGLCVHAGPFGPEALTTFVSCAAALMVFTTLYAVREGLPYVRVLDWLANVSYPLYLVHTVVGWVVMRGLFQVFTSWLLVMALTVAIVITLAALIHRYVEVPTNRLGRRLSSPTPATESEAVLRPTADVLG